VRPIRHTFATFNGLALVVLGVPFAASQAQQRYGAAAIEKPSFEVASIKPSRPGEGNHDWDSNSDPVTIENYCLRDLIASAYDLKSDSQVLGGPNWLDNKHFDIAAKVDYAELAKLKTMTGNDTRNEWNQMMQSLLADRFGLKVRLDQRTIPVYALVVAKSGQKLALVTAKETNHSLSGRNSHLTATAISMASLANYLTHTNEAEDRVVVDRTGLTGDFNFKLDWTRDRGNGIPPDAQYPDMFTALREQLGLELKPDKAPVDVVVVESAKEPELD
jgi:uncharacterized protein (TIGR03435 family)